MMKVRVHQNCKFYDPRDRFSFAWAWTYNKNAIFLLLFLSTLGHWVFANSYLSPLGKGCGPSFVQMNPLHPRMLCGKFGWNWSGGSRDDDENVKCFWQPRQWQRRRQRQRKDTLAHLILLLRWAKLAQWMLKRTKHLLTDEGSTLIYTRVCN